MDYTAAQLAAIETIDDPLLIVNLLLQGNDHRGLPLFSLRQLRCLVILLYQHIARIACVPDETIWLGRLERRLERLLHNSSTICSECIPGTWGPVDYERPLLRLVLARQAGIAFLRLFEENLSP